LKGSLGIEEIVQIDIEKCLSHVIFARGEDLPGDLAIAEAVETIFQSHMLDVETRSEGQGGRIDPKGVTIFTLREGEGEIEVDAVSDKRYKEDTASPQDGAAPSLPPAIEIESAHGMTLRGGTRMDEDTTLSSKSPPYP
jgi:hypothetical protein